LFPWFFYSSVPAYMPGTELQVNAIPVDHLLVNFTLGYLRFHSKISDPTDPSYIDPSVRLQPEWNMSGGIQYDWVLPNAATLTPRLDWRYQGYITNGPEGVPQISPQFIVPGYSIFNARLTYAPSSAKWSLSLQALNLFNKFYYVQLGAADSLTGTNPYAPGALSPAVARVGTPGLPREWMATFALHF
jgi:iron complex outermembrane recepter protein